MLPDTASPWTSELVSRQVERFRTSWRRADGIYATSYRGPRTEDDAPLIGDLGDTAPILAALGYVREAVEQAELCLPRLRDGLFWEGGRLRLFGNHDLLLGLVELFRLTGEAWLESAIWDAVDTLENRCAVHDLLVDGIDRTHAWRLRSANPFNGGYIELLVDFYMLTGDERALILANRWASAWLRTPYFTRHGLFARFNTPELPWAGYFYSKLSRFGAVRLFKDNTNLVWSLAALHRVTQEPSLARAMRRFVEALSRHHVHDGIGMLYSSDSAKRFNLRASCAALDLLCDLTHLELDRTRTLQLATDVARECLKRQWPSGLVPLADAEDRDHLDLQVDLGIGLCKLAELSGSKSYAEAALRCWRATLGAHETEHGFVLAVGESGDIVDDAIIVKYQALMLKPRLLWTLPGPIYANPNLWRLLRDR